jgi:hypothetical protein
MNSWTLDYSSELFSGEISILEEYESDKSGTRSPLGSPAIRSVFPDPNEMDDHTVPIYYISTPVRVAFTSIDPDKVVSMAPTIDLFHQQRENLAPNLCLSPSPHLIPKRLFRTSPSDYHTFTTSSTPNGSRNGFNTPLKKKGVSRTNSPRTPLRTLATPSSASKTITKRYKGCDVRNSMLTLPVFSHFRDFVFP